MAAGDLRAAAFPTLSEAQIAELARCTRASLQGYQAGQTLFKLGDRDFQFFVIQSGEVEIQDPTGETPHTITTHRRGAFTGDVSHLTGNPSLVTAVAKTDCEVYAVSADGLRQIINQCPDLGDIILQAFIARRQLLRESGDFTGLRVIGSRYSQDTFRIRDFLAKNRVLFTWIDLETDPEVDRLLKQFGVTEADTPVVACGRMLLLRNPSNRALADELGIHKPLEQVIYDLVIVGAGPAGLAAAVYGASEALKTVVVERTAPGGQAASSMRIENYLGFPTGISGAELADRAVLQANKFGAKLSVAALAIGLTFDNAYSVLKLEGGETVVAKCLLIASGAEYRRLMVEGCAKFEGCGVYYAATPNEAQLCRGSDVVLVGGGNSAGQAAVFLAGNVRKIFLLLRHDDLHRDMSSYLAQRIERTPNIEVLRDTEIARMSGDNYLSAVEIVNKKTGEKRTIKTAAVFSFIGALPHTGWLPKEITKDDKGFVRTGTALTRSGEWSGKRQPFLLETSRAGVFAAGDVRADSVKHAASAVGEGAMAVQFVHEYLKEM